MTWNSLTDSLRDRHRCLLTELVPSSKRFFYLIIRPRVFSALDIFFVNALYKSTFYLLTYLAACGFRLRNGGNARNASDCVWMETGLYRHNSQIDNDYVTVRFTLPEKWCHLGEVRCHRGCTSVITQYFTRLKRWGRRELSTELHRPPVIDTGPQQNNIPRQSSSNMENSKMFSQKLPMRGLQLSGPVSMTGGVLLDVNLIRKFWKFILKSVHFLAVGMPVDPKRWEDQ